VKVRLVPCRMVQRHEATPAEEAWQVWCAGASLGATHEGGVVPARLCAVGQDACLAWNGGTGQLARPAAC